LFRIGDAERGNLESFTWRVILVAAIVIDLDEVCTKENRTIEL